jgi:hypothetical protein
MHLFLQQGMSAWASVSRLPSSSTVLSEAKAKSRTYCPLVGIESQVAEIVARMILAEKKVALA